MVLAVGFENIGGCHNLNKLSTMKLSMDDLENTCGSKTSTIK